MDAKIRANAAAQAAAAAAATSTRSLAPIPHAGSSDRPRSGEAGADGEARHPAAWHTLHPGLAALAALEPLDDVVLNNIHVDGAPLVGRARLQLQFLWRDIAGRCCTLQVDYMPCASASPPPSRPCCSVLPDRWPESPPPPHQRCSGHTVLVACSSQRPWPWHQCNNQTSTALVHKQRKAALGQAAA